LIIIKREIKSLLPEKYLPTFAMELFLAVIILIIALFLELIILSPRRPK